MRSIFFLFFLLAACSERQVSYPQKTPPAGFLQQPGNIEAGQAVFLQKCAWCHGTVEEGRIAKVNNLVPEPSDLTSPRYRNMEPAYLFWRIATGKQAEPFRSRGSVMPAWHPYFSEEKIWKLVAYIRARPVAEGRM